MLLTAELQSNLLAEIWDFRGKQHRKPIIEAVLFSLFCLRSLHLIVVNFVQFENV